MKFRAIALSVLVCLGAYSPKNQAFLPLSDCNTLVNFQLQTSTSFLTFLTDPCYVLAIAATIYTAYHQAKAYKTHSREQQTPDMPRAATSTVRFQDVAGATQAKEELQDLVTYLKNPEAYTMLDAIPPTGVLLYGPPGTSKTLLAKAFAGEVGCSFIAVNASFVGTVRELFEQARKQAPCIIFIDEIDSIDIDLNQLLAGFRSAKDQRIFVIAATNRIDELDESLLCAGHFDKKIAVNIPTQNERKDILMVHAQHIKLDPSIDFEHISQSTQGYSGADLAELLKDAARIATKAKKSCVELSDIFQALHTIAQYKQENTALCQPCISPSPQT